MYLLVRGTYKLGCVELWYMVLQGANMCSRPRCFGEIHMYADLGVLQYLLVVHHEIHVLRIEGHYMTGLRTSQGRIILPS
jgi:hypothetical protein